VKCGSAEKSVRENFVTNFPGSQFQVQQASMNLIKVRSTGSLLDKKPDKKCHVLIKEELYKIRARSENTPQNSLRCLAQETGISKSSADKGTKQ
jgi:hypothetical protein